MSGKLERAKQKALNQVSSDAAQTERLFVKLRARIHEATPESIREAADLEYELTGDMVATTYMGEALNLSEFFDCDCSEYYESLQQGDIHITAVGHVPGCKYEAVK